MEQEQRRRPTMSSKTQAQQRIKESQV
ncbi:unnamed protein product, partial [Rotaria sp. Silwood2]